MAQRAFPPWFDAEQKMGAKFNLAGFHDQVLKDGAMPLSVLEAKINAWAAAHYSYQFT